MLDRIPPEILDRIILLCDPIDVARLSQLSRCLYGHFHPNNNLWRRIFLQYFDDPGGAEPDVRSAFESHSSTVKMSHQATQIDWRRTLVARIVLRQTLSSTESPLFIRRLGHYYSPDRLESVYQLIFLILYTARPAQHHSRNLAFLRGLLSNPTAQLQLFHLPVIQTVNWTTPVPRSYPDIPDLAQPARWAPAKLHAVFGLTGFDAECSKTRGLARERTYSVANYRRENLYGPFVPSESTPGRTNWDHLRDLGLVVSLNLYDIHRSQHSPIQRPLPNLPMDPPPFTVPLHPPPLDRPPFAVPLEPPAFAMPNAPEELPHPNLPPSDTTPPQSKKIENIDWPILSSLESAVPFTQITHPTDVHPSVDWPPSLNLNGGVDLTRYDWAGVTGRWLRVVCFLDYRNWAAFNFGESKSTLEDVNEVIRSMTLDLKVVSIRDPPDDSHPIPPALRTDLPHRPPIFFNGTLRYNVSLSSEPIAQQVPSTLRGCVSMTMDDEVRWSMVSTVKERDKWASEGIQIGGVRSKWGVLGAWTDVNRAEIGAPVGPFYFYKTCG